MPRYNIDDDQATVIQRALADRGEHLEELLEQWSHDPAMDESEDPGLAEDELDILRLLQAADLAGRPLLDRADVACIQNALAGWGEQLQNDGAVTELAVVRELQAGPFPIPGQG